MIDIIIVGAAILPEQEFQHIDRHIRPFLDLLRQILADDPAAELFPQFLLDRLAVTDHAFIQISHDTSPRCILFQRSPVNPSLFISMTMP